MANVSLKEWAHYIPLEQLADHLERFGVTCERKRNGNVWAKQNQNASDEYFDFKSAVYDLFGESCSMPNRSKIDYAFFDHAGYYTAEDGTTVLVFHPYWGGMHWPALVNPLWEKGYYVEMHSSDPNSFIECTVFVRKKKDGDEMFQLPPEAVFARELNDIIVDFV